MLAIKPWFESSCLVFVIASSARNAALDICQVSARIATDRTWSLSPRTAPRDGSCTVLAVCRRRPVSGVRRTWSDMKSASKPIVAVTVHRTKCGMWPDIVGSTLT